MEYSRSWNLGDEIQTMAVAQHLESFDGYVDRDYLDRVEGDEFALVMNGWFCKRPDTFPPSPSVRPVWLGFHLSPHYAEVLQNETTRDLMLRSGPIGCRDEGTSRLLERHDIAAFVSGCMTTTFPLREHQPEEQAVYLVDTGGIPLPEQIRSAKCVRTSHQGAQWWSQEGKRRLAADLLEEYRSKATLVVTPRLHCALPCVAMGIPVVFVGDPDDPRLSPITGLAEMIPFPDRLRNEAVLSRAKRRSYWWREMKDHAWSGLAADIEDDKLTRVARLRQCLANLQPA
ncbi:MAG: polysaccharide pyruvyl transferase family protein [Microthrixaceae bacterium]|nr:polysaccharide pyruvyl transferase family protein [Microthrixaceae bacterium]